LIENRTPNRTKVSLSDKINKSSFYRDGSRD